jgi:tetrahydromethanopterin S-methyltransferase subunit G
VSAQPLEARLAHLEGVVAQVAERLNCIDRRLDSMDGRFDRLEQKLDLRFAAIDGRFGQIDQRFGQIDQRFNWLIGIVLGTWITTMLTILFHH